MNYTKLDKVDGKYLVSNNINGAVSVFTDAELIMLSLFDIDDIKPLKKFIVNQGVYHSSIEEIINSFKEKIKNDGWLRGKISDKKETYLSSAYLNITDKCNFKCVYCFQGRGGTINHVLPDMSLEFAKKIIYKIYQLNPKCRVILTGGEPFLNNHCLEICQYIDSLNMSFSILTNASLITKEISLRLSRLKKLVNVQISIDGISEKVHQITRGKTFKKTWVGIQHIIESKVPFSLAPTIHNNNLEEIIQLAEFAFDNGGGFTPNNYRNLSDVPQQNIRLDDDNFLKILLSVEKHLISKFGKKRLIKEKSRTFINKDIKRDYYICGAGCETFDIKTNGDVYPCHLIQKPQFKLGNFLNDNFESIISNVKEHGIRKKTYEIEKCQKCHFMSICGGGCKAASYENYKRFDKEDPLCSVLYENLLNSML